MISIIAFIVGLVIGFVGGNLFYRKHKVRLMEAEKELKELRGTLQDSAENLRKINSGD